MYGVWIYKKDQRDYEQLMNGHPIILQEKGDKLQVNFTNEAMSTWVAVGHWYSFDPD